VAELHDKHLAREIARIDGRRAAVILVQRCDAERHRKNGDDGECDVQRLRERCVPASAERSPQRHGRPGRDGHQHDADLGGMGDVECARDDPRNGGDGDENREQRPGHEARTLDHPPEVPRHGGKSEVEHDREQCRSRREGEQPIGNGSGDVHGYVIAQKFHRRIHQDCHVQKWP
jgi:hypothetical protein